MNFFKSLTPRAAEMLQKVRLFTQMYWLESGSGVQAMFRMPNFRPTLLTITIRYSDWWWWEDDALLRMQEIWLQTFVGTPGLRELRVEYETRMPKKDEMMRIVERNKKYKLPIRREGGSMDDWEGYLSAEETKLKEWTWKGTSKLGGREWGHLVKSDTVEYVVVTDTWKFVEERVEPGDLGRKATGEEYRALSEDEDEYYDEVSSHYSDTEEESEGHSEEEEDDDDENDDESDGEYHGESAE